MVYNNMMVRFGPSSNDILFYEQGNKSSVQAPKWLSDMGLSAYEISFGRGVKMGDKMAEEMKTELKKYNIAISVHAPYFINLGNPDAEAIKKSYNYIESCVRKVNLMGGNRVVIHVGSQSGLSREKALENCRKNLLFVVNRLRENGFKDFLLCIETMGRYSMIGDYREICELCKTDPNIIPTLDFGHINCTEQGELQRKPQRMREILEYCINEIGREKMQNVHIHFSAIVFGPRGEHKHTTLDDKKWSIPFEPLAKAVKEFKLDPVFICESEDIMAQDAKRMQDIWQRT